MIESRIDVIKSNLNTLRDVYNRDESTLDSVEHAERAINTLLASSNAYCAGVAATVEEQEDD